MDAFEIVSHVGPAVVTLLGLDDRGVEVSQGSGFIATTDGVVATAWHVVSKAVQVRARLSIGAFFEVQGLIAWDPDLDFALLKVEGSGLPTVPLGDSDSVRQGDAILTVSAPLGLEQTASEGIVSAVREWPQRGRVLQITAPISPGSSGGPVLDARGEVVGIVSFLMVQGQNLNFAIPINQIKPKLNMRGDITAFGEGRSQALLASGAPHSPDISDIEILYWTLESRSGLLSVKGEFKNNSSCAVQVELMAIARDKQGRVVTVSRWLEPTGVALSPHGTWPIDYGFVFDTEEIERTDQVTLQVVCVYPQNV